MSNWEHNYLVHDEFGLQQILCMCCEKPIKTRAEQRSMIDPSVILRDMAKHADYREVPVFLEEGGVAFIMVCDNCKLSEITDAVAAKITEQLIKAMRSQLEFEGKIEDIISAVLEKMSRRVTRKAEVSEVTNAMRNI